MFFDLFQYIVNESFSHRGAHNLEFFGSDSIVSAILHHYSMVLDVSHR